MNSNADAILTHTAVVQDAAAASDALLTGDVDEARFRIHLVVAKADIAEFEQVSRAAALLLATLGAPGNVPGTGYGASLINLADELGSASPLAGKARQRQSGATSASVTVPRELPRRRHMRSSLGRIQLDEVESDSRSDMLKGVI